MCVLTKKNDMNWKKKLARLVVAKTQSSYKPDGPRRWVYLTLSLLCTLLRRRTFLTTVYAREKFENNVSSPVWLFYVGRKAEMMIPPGDMTVIDHYRMCEE